MTVTSLSTSLAEFTGPSTTPASGPLLLPVDFYSFYQEVIKASDSNLPLATRSAWAPPESKRKSDQDWPDFTFHAISCGDSIDESNITTQVVFDELIRVVKDVSPMCKSSYFD
jgi:hypothetical protein